MDHLGSLLVAAWTAGQLALGGKLRRAELAKLQHARDPLPQVLSAANVAMALLFAYASYTQLNDSDWYIWLPLYAGAALMSVLEAAGLEDLGRQVALANLAICSLLPASSAAEAAIALHKAGAAWPTAILGSLGLSVDTEHGREHMGLLVIGVWMSAQLLVPYLRSSSTFSPAGDAELVLPKGGPDFSSRFPLVGGLLVAFAGLVLLSAYVVPNYLIDPQKLAEDEHCYGLGITPKQLHKQEL
eukprot:SM000214S06800  [mRNA]  locus=s214:123383:124214:- [translate_table: standard]